MSHCAPRMDGWIIFDDDDDDDDDIDDIDDLLPINYLYIINCSLRSGDYTI